MLLRFHHLLGCLTLTLFLVAEGLIASHDLWCDCHASDHLQDPSAPPTHCPCDCVLSGFTQVVCERPTMPPTVLLPTFDRSPIETPYLYTSPSLDHFVPPPRG